jgi:hemerythrin
MADEKKKSEFHQIMLQHNVLIVWNPEYDLGIPIIDEQHRGIVSTINSLYFGMQNSYGKNMLSPIVDMMHDYTRIHFQIEESFLEKIDFPNAKKHHELHRELSYQLTDAGKSSMMDKDPYKFLVFLKNWWLIHIGNEDLIYRNYIISLPKK